MKSIVLTSLIIALSLPLSYAQSLSQFYNNETVHLKQVPAYAEMNDWNELFSDYYNVEKSGRALGRIKRIVVAPDGSAFMSHKTTYAIWKFDSNGELVKKFGKKGSGKGEFVMRATVGGILDGKYLYTTDNQGRISLFDLVGNYIKSLKLDYGPLRTVPLSHMKIAIFGHVPMGKGKVKNIISILDTESGKENIIWEDFKDPSYTEIELSNGKSMLVKLNISFPDITMFGISATSNGNLLVASNGDHTLSEYSSDGKLIRSFPLDIEPFKITDADIDKMYEVQLETFDRFQERLSEERRLTEEELNQVTVEYKKRLEAKREELKGGDLLPIYSTIITDSEDNILVFEFTEEKGSNQFSAFAFDPKGTLIGVSKFASDAYDLTFTPANFVIHDRYVYAVATKKESDGVPLRLVKFELSKECL